MFHSRLSAVVLVQALIIPDLIAACLLTGLRVTNLELRLQSVLCGITWVPLLKCKSAPVCPWCEPHTFPPYALRSGYAQLLSCQGFSWFCAFAYEHPSIFLLPLLKNTCPSSESHRKGLFKRKPFLIDRLPSQREVAPIPQAPERLFSWHQFTRGHLFVCGSVSCLLPYKLPDAPEIYGPVHGKVRNHPRIKWNEAGIILLILCSWSLGPGSQEGNSMGRQLVSSLWH